MGPSDFRYDPYNDIPTGVERTERHVIPANSPYHIRLNEVPQKESPSTISVKEITDIAESVTYGQTFSEVAANPSAGEFWPDCNTGANGDENWNTGLITFNAADAGKLIEVSYTGTGTLAAVNSNHWPSWYTDRGDGSDGDFAPTENTDISGIKQYSSVNIPEEIKVTVKGNVFIKCTGAVNVIGTLSASGQGASGGARGSTSGGNGSPGKNGYGCGRGGYGGDAKAYTGGAGGGSKYFYRGSLVDMTDDYFYKDLLTGNLLEYCGAGGGGGACDRAWWRGMGGNGGGCIIIVANEINITGLITAAGDSADNSDGYGGASGGGLIVCIANKIDGQENTDVSKGYGYGSGSDVATDGRKYLKELGVI